MSKLFDNKVANFFTIIGTLATVMSTYFALNAYLSDSSDPEITGFKKVQMAAARAVAPSGFEIRPAQFNKVPNNTDFQIGVENPVLITDYEVPFMVMGIDAVNQRVKYSLNGRGEFVAKGGVSFLSGTGCQLWLYAIEPEAAFFKMDCK